MLGIRDRVSDRVRLRDRVRVKVRVSTTAPMSGLKPQVPGARVRVRG